MIAKTKNKVRFLEQYWKIIVIIAFTFILYGNTVNNKYSLDDEYVICKNEKIQKGIAAIPEIFTSYYAKNLDVKFGYRPVTQVLYAVEYELFGENPHISHMINVLLYIISALILMSVLEKLFVDYNVLLPFLITILFIAHPIHTEVVASLKNREELLSFLFALLALLFALRYVKKKRVHELVLAVVFFMIAYLSKETSFTFVLLIPLSLYFFTDIKLLKAVLIFVLFFVVGYGLRKIISIKFPGTYETSYFENPLVFSERFLIKLSSYPNILWFYIKKLVFPHPLGYYYGYNMIPLKTFSVFTFLSIGIHLFMLVFAIIGYRKKKLFAFAFFYYLISIFLFSNMTVKINGIVGERLVYQASLGFILIMVLLIFAIFKIPVGEKYIPFKKIRYVVAIIVLLLIPYSAKTIIRNSDWYDHYTLYASDIDYLKNSAKANSLIGNWIHQHLDEFEGEEKDKVVRDAKKYYKQSLNIDKDALVANNLGTIYLLYIQNPDSAIKYFKLCVALDSTYSQGYFNLAQCYELKNESDLAVSSYKKALKYNLDYLNAISKISIKYAENRFYRQAIRLNEILIDENPNSPVPYYNLANIYVLTGDTIKGLEYAEKSLDLNPGNRDLAQKTAIFYKLLGNSEKANYYFNLAD